MGDDYHGAMRALRFFAAAALVLAACAPGAERTSSNNGAKRGIRTELGDGLTVTKDTDGKTIKRKGPDLADGAHGATTTRATLALRTKPRFSSNTERLTMANPIDQRLVLLIEDTRSTGEGEWLEVLLPERPNGSTAWVARADVKVVEFRHRIEISLARHRLDLFRGDERVHRFEVGVGQDQYPTPKGTFYVWAKVDQPSPTGPYGNYALGISGFSPVLSDWPGGGRAAVHGTANPSDKGQKVSHGCIRVFNEDMKKLTGLPMGTPVIIRN